MQAGQAPGHVPGAAAHFLVKKGTSMTVAHEDSGPWIEQPLDLHCSFCGKGYQLVEHLIAGPGMCAICSTCIEAIASADSTRQELEGPICHFCGKVREEVAHIAYGPQGVHMCNECIVLAGEILAEEAACASGSRGTPADVENETEP